MTSASRGEFLERLLATDPLPSGQDDVSRRQKLQQRLERFERQERLFRYLTIAICGGGAAFLPFALLTQWFVPRGGLPAGLLGDVVYPAATVMIFACGILSIPMLIVYFGKYRRLLDRTRDEARDQILSELERELE